MEEIPSKNQLHDFIWSVSYREIEESKYNWAGTFRSTDYRKWAIEDRKKGKLRENHGHLKYKIPLDFSVRKKYVLRQHSEDIINNCKENCTADYTRSESFFGITNCFSRPSYSSSARNCSQYPPRVRKILNLKLYSRKRNGDERWCFYIPKFYSIIGVPEDIDDIDGKCDYLAKIGSKILLSI